MNSPLPFRILATAVSAAALCGPASAALNFVRLGTLQNGGSSFDTRLASGGNGVTGVADNTIGAGEGFYWDTSTRIRGVGVLSNQVIGSHGRGISGDGRVVVGSSDTANGITAFRWTRAGGIRSIGDLPGGRVDSAALGASMDGNVVVGYGATDTGVRGFRWTPAGGMTALGLLSGETYSKAYAVSDDGNIIVGMTSHFEGNTEKGQAVMWSPRAILGLGDLPGGPVWAEALAVNGSGAAVAGWSVSLYGGEGFRWTAETGMTGLGDFPGGRYDSRALAISGDGATLVGYGTTAAGKEAFVWDQVNGMRSLRSLLEAEGMNVDGWSFLEASGISADGTVIAGTAKTPQGNWEAFVVSGFTPIPEPSAAGPLILLAGAAALRRRRAGQPRP